MKLNIPEERECKYCHNLFITEESAQVYCSEQCGRDGKNKGRRENRLRKKEALNLVCLYCGKPIIGKNKIKFCNDICKNKYHSQQVVKKFKIIGYPKKSREELDKYNEERRKLRRDFYLYEEHKCKECGIILTLEHYPRTKFCSEKCKIKYFAKTINKRTVIQPLLTKEEAAQNQSPPTQLKEKLILVEIKPGTWIEIPESQKDRIPELIEKHKKINDIKTKIKRPVSWAIIT